MRPIFLYRSEYLEFESSQIARGILAFSAAELARFSELWIAAKLIAHTFHAATFELPGGERIEAAPDFLRTFGRPSHDVLRATVKHVAEVWGGRAALQISPDTTREDRLWMRAYAEVYGVRIDDNAECYAAFAFTRADLAQLPGMRAKIRLLDPDTPPAPPDEDRQLQGQYARRFPHRGLALA